jgi:predicted amidohydrolase YtcJ
MVALHLSINPKIMNRIFLLAIVILASCTEKPTADLVVYGKIWTGNPEQPWAEAMAINSDTIVAIGSKTEIEKYEGTGTQKIKAPSGGLITPGFIDTHTHFVDGGFRLSSVQLRDAKTKEEFINRIKQYASKLKPGEWITGGDWDHENWGGELPTRDWIDSVTQNNPVWINRLDGHMSLANSAALTAANVNDQIEDVAGGTIIRTNKKLSGIFKDNATQYVEAAVPNALTEQEDFALDTAMAYVASKGVTSVHSMSGYMNALARAQEQNRLITRIYAGMPLTEWKALAEKIKQSGRGGKWLKIGNLKAFVDGSLGSHTAAFFKPFADTPTDSGFMVIGVNELQKLIYSADSAGLHVMTHAIGDKAIHTLLNIYEAVASQNGERDRRFRIEHAQHIRPDDIKRFADLKVIASMQPYHSIDDGRWAEKIIGYERSKTTYAFKSLMDAGAIVAFGSDWFVAPPTPLDGIYAAVTRRTLDDKNPDGWIPEQKISVEDALRAYTVNAAFSSFEESTKGALKPGMLADFVVLEKDITTIDPVEIRNVLVLRTVVGAKTVYQKIN